jgi:transposase
VSENAITYVGLDVHKKSIAVALLPAAGGEPLEWQEANEIPSIHRLVRRLKRDGGEVFCCYEAGPTGYALWRQLTALGLRCMVVAPSLIPVKPGSRVKTDQRDARKLAELLRAGLLTEVTPPSESDEALRDLCRCRDDVRDDLLRARHRMSKFLLRRHCMFTGSKHHWGTRHMHWLEQLRFDDAASQATFDSYFLAIQQNEERMARLDAHLAEFGAQEPYREPVAWLRCFRGIDTVTAVSLVAELHDFRRFRSARALMAYLGLVPSEHSSGESERRGSITKSGNRHVRRLLVEAAWHNRHRPGLSAPLKKRREGQPDRVLAIADRAQQRLSRRFMRMVARGKPSPKAVVAMARELVGYIWATLYPQSVAAAAQG